MPASITANIHAFKAQMEGTSCRLVAVTKTKPVDMILEAYYAGIRLMGENKVQEMVSKWDVLPKDIEWHMIGHLQRNKVKYIAPFVSMIHSIDSLRLLGEVNKEGLKNQRVIPCLLQVHIAHEETKFGFDPDEILDLLTQTAWPEWLGIRLVGLMGMATFTDDQQQIRLEFKELRQLFEKAKALDLPDNCEMKELSMGMSGDYAIALEEGSTLIRVGSAIFGSRN